ncbi:hypothetical protein LXL04_016631 [Taraxacum kok-saghyz]
MLPEDAKVEEIRAEMKDGVLHVIIPKDDTKKKHVKEIKPVTPTPIQTIPTPPHTDLIPPHTDHIPPPTDTTHSPLNLTFRPVVKPASIGTILGLAASRHWHIHQLDFICISLHVSATHIIRITCVIFDVPSMAINRPKGPSTKGLPNMLFLWFSAHTGGFFLFHLSSCTDTTTFISLPPTPLRVYSSLKRNMHKRYLSGYTCINNPVETIHKLDTIGPLVLNLSFLSCFSVLSGTSHSPLHTLPCSSTNLYLHT